MSLRRFIKNKAIPILAESSTAMEAIQGMIQTGSGAALIADERSILKGIFTERDVMTRITAVEKDPKTTLLRDVMTGNVLRTTDSVAINEAIQVMVDHRIRHLPVVGPDGKIIGLISLRYLLHDKIAELMSEVCSLESYFNDAPGG